MAKKLRLGVIGCGNMGRGVHIEAYKRMDNVEIISVCDVIRERAELASEMVGGAQVFENFQDLINAGGIDAVDICTPNYLHSIIAVDAFKAGKHVLCEKPDAVNVEEVLKMKNAADEAGKVLMVIRNNRFATASQYAKKFVEDGKMGDIYCGRCGWQRRRGIPGKGGWFTTKAQSGGGPLIDLGVHMIDLAVWLMGNPTPVAVSANTYTKFADNDTSDSVNSKFGDKNDEGTFDVEDLVMGMIRFDNGAVLQIEFSWASNIKQETRYVELRGTKAGLKWDENEVEFFTEDNGQLLDIVPKGKMETDGHKYNIKNFVDVLTEGAEPVFKPSQGVDMIKILCAIYESAEKGREVVL